MQESLLAQFRADELLNWNDDTKVLILKGQINDQLAIMILSKQQFNKDIQSLCIAQCPQTQFFSNDIYTKYNISMQENVVCELIYPATQHHIDKHKRSEYILTTEEPTLSKKDMSLTWLYNILEKQSEVDQILVDHQEFIILKDYTFQNSINMDRLHLLGIPTRKDIKSIRDLRQDHLVLLQQIQQTTLDCINETYGIERNKIRIFVHYPPTFYHFHIHFKHVSCQGESFRDIPLSQVIQNIQLDTQYYQKVAIEYLMKQ